MKTIMVIDDEIDILQKVKSSLENDEYQVEVAEDSRQALEKISENSEENFGLILIDTPLPGTQKTALFSMKPKSKMRTDISKTEDFLQKPFTEQQLINFVKSKL